MTLSTLSPEGKPQSAAVEYAVTDDLTIIFDTFNSSRKYRNLRLNAAVSCVMVHGNQTVQLEGEAHELDEADASLKEHFFTSIPRGKKFDARPETRYFKIIPHWIRYADYGKNPWEVMERTI